MVCFDVPGGLRAAPRASSTASQVIQRATSLGGVESLVSLPVLTSQYGLQRRGAARAPASRAGMLRLSVGLEDEADLIADLDQALGVSSRTLACSGPILESCYDLGTGFGFFFSVGWCSCRNCTAMLEERCR